MLRSLLTAVRDWRERRRKLAAGHWLRWPSATCLDGCPQCEESPLPPTRKRLAPPPVRRRKPTPEVSS